MIDARRSWTPNRTSWLLFAGVLFTLATGRWGSYVHIPGLPVYIGDLLLLSVLASMVYFLRMRAVRLDSLRDAPRTLQLAGILLVWALLRVVTRTSLPLVAVRDMAPYAYAVAALPAFLLPMQAAHGVRRWIYAALAAHAAWYCTVVLGLIDPATTVMLAEGAPLFSTRPDFDAAIFGISIAFALHQIAFGPRPKSAGAIAAMVGFIAVNAFPLSKQHSRSGLLAAAIASGIVIASWVLRGRVGTANHRQLLLRGAISTGAIVAAVAALLLTVPGQRLVGGLEAGEASGKSSARVSVYKGLAGWLTDSPALTVFGVGYGPNILARSKTVHLLEGTEFQNVRSPHNYLLGTWARLGLIGAALAAALLVAGVRLAIRQLGEQGQPADTLAALIALTMPVVALFGVILESPFGAIPYFWAVGHLCSVLARRPGPPADGTKTVSAGT